MTDEKNDDLPDECKKAFERWLSEKSLSAATEEDSWGQEIYKYPKIEAMWYAWKGAWNARAQPVADDECTAALKWFNKQIESLEDHLKSGGGSLRCDHNKLMKQLTHIETIRRALNQAQPDDLIRYRHKSFHPDDFEIVPRGQAKDMIPDGMVLMPRDVLMSWFNVAGFEVPVKLAIAPFEDGELGIYQATKQCRS